MLTAVIRAIIAVAVIIAAQGAAGSIPSADRGAFHRRLPMSITAIDIVRTAALIEEMRI